MITKADEKGQALILIVLAAVGLFAFAALAIDGSMAFSDKRHAQNAADTAALAGALSYAREGNTSNIEGIALARAKSNGYENIPGDASALVTVSIADVPEEECPGDATGKDITVDIVSTRNTTFARVIGREQLTSAVTATSRACGYKLVPWFDGNAIVGLNNNISPCELGFDTGNSSSVTWRIEGGGIFSNSCAFSKEDDTITFDPGVCISTVGGVTRGSDWDCTPQLVSSYDWESYVLANMPPNPCDGTPNDIGIWPDLDAPPNYSDGVYCINNLDKLDSKDITLNNATLYVTDPDFELKFSGGGGFYGTATKAGTYAGSDDYADYYMIVKPAQFCSGFSDNTNSQRILWRGNGSGTFYGTVIAPTACLDLRGNGWGDGMHTQIIGWIVGSNGTADTYINYKQEENHMIPIHPNISLLE